jgi:hypothetical protein
MAQYTPQIEAYIAGKLKLQGWLDAAGIPGLPDDEALAFLQRYLDDHAEDALHIDGMVLRVGAPAAPAATGVDDAPEAVLPGPVVLPPPSYSPPPQPPGVGGPPVTTDPAPYAASPPSPTGSAGGYVVPGRDDPGYIPEPEPASNVPKWMWLLPIVFALFGGVAGWAILRDRDPKGARNLLILGIAVTVVSACLPFALGLGGGLVGLGGASSVPTETTWPQTGALTFYYFGSPG